MGIKRALQNSLSRAGLEVRANANFFHFDRAHRREADRALKGAGPISKKDARLCDEYAAEVLGSKAYAPWLRLYCAVSGAFKDGWIPDNYYARYVVTRRNGEIGAASDLKTMSARLFDSSAIPDLAYHVGERFFDSERRLVSDSVLPRLLFASADRVVFKQDSIRRGQGIHFIRRREFSTDAIRRLGSGVFQRPVSQHPFFDSFSPGSVATLRLTSVIGDGGLPSVRACYLRGGRDSDTHIRSATHVRIAVSLETGALSPVGYLPDWSRITRHPDTGEEFGGSVVPCLDKCVALVADLHSRLPFVQCIGWDLAVNADGRVEVLEWNGGHNDIKFSEAVQGPCFADLDWHLLWRRPRT